MKYTYFAQYEIDILTKRWTFASDSLRRGPRVISNVDDKWPAYFIVQVNLILANPLLKFCGGSDQPGLTSVIIESIGEQRLAPYQPTCL